MLRFLADENFNNQIVRGVLSQNPHVDVVRMTHNFVTIKCKI